MTFRAVFMARIVEAPSQVGFDPDQPKGGSHTCPPRVTLASPWLTRLKNMPVPLVVKLKAIALTVGKRLTTDISEPRENGEAKVSADPVPAPISAPRGLAPLTGVVPKVELAPQSTGQQQFARQCTL